MNHLITLEHFHTENRHFHIYMPGSSSVAAEPHFHDYFQMLYVLSGEVRHEHEGRTLSLFAGDAFIIPPMFTHRLEFSSAKTSVYSLAFSADLFHAGFVQSNIYRFLSELCHGGNGEEDVHLRIRLSEAQQEIFSMLMECLMREQETCPGGTYTAVPSLISSALYVLAQSYRTGISTEVWSGSADTGKCSAGTAGREASDISSGNRKAIRDCIRYIDNHFTEELSIQKMSREFAVSHSSLCSLFKEYTGLSVRKYVRNKRILKAESLLRRDPGMSLAEIASAVGYPEPSTFFRNFTEMVGVSPSRYRMNYRQPD